MPASVRPFKFSVTRSSLLFVFAVLLSLTPVACKRGSESSGARGPGVLDTQVALSLPKEAIGFVAWRTDVESFQALKKAGLAENNTLASTLKQLKNSSNAPEAQRAIDALLKSGFISTDASQAPVSEQGIAFMARDVSNPSALPTLGFYLRAAKGHDLSAKADSLKAALKELGSTVTEETGVAGTVAFAAKFNAPTPEAASNPFSELHFRLNKDFLAAGINSAVADHLFKADAQGAEFVFATHPDFNKVIEKNKDQFLVAFLDAAGLASSLKAVVANLPANTDTSQLDKLPLSAVGFTRSFETELHDQVQVALKAQSPEQQRWLDSLNGEGAGPGLELLPSDVLFALTLDGKVINSLISAASQDMPDQQKAMINSQLANISELREITVAIRQTTSPLPIPDIFILARNSQATQLRALLKTAGAAIAATQSAAAGVQLAWTTRSVAGLEVDAMVHPLGIGAFMTSDSSALMIASSEKAISDLLDVKSGKIPSLASESKSSPAGFLKGHMDFQKLAAMIEGLQANIAVLTGGKSNFDTSQLDSMKKLGSSDFAIKASPGLLSLDVRTAAK